MITILITLLIFVIVAGIALFILQRYVAPALPEPFRVWFLAICGLIAVIVLIALVYPSVLNAPLVH